MTEKRKAIYKDHLKRLEPMYFELLEIFHANNHQSVSKSIHAAIFELDRAIKDLEEALGIDE